MMKEPKVWDVVHYSYDGVKRSSLGDCKQGMYEPGNGTRYTALAVRLYGEVTFGSLGSVTDGWLVVNGLNQKAYLFQSSHVRQLADVYIQEKLGGFDGDYPYFGDLVRELIRRPILGD